MRTSVAAAVLAACLIAPDALAASAVRDQILSRALYFKTSACHVLKIEFNLPTRYVSHYPYDSGNELRIELDTLSSSPGDAAFEGRRESLHPPNESDEVLASITYEGNTVPRPVLTLAFRQVVAFKVAQGEDFRSVIVAIARPHGSGVCEPVFPATE